MNSITLKDITLEQIPEEEYEQLDRFWYGPKSYMLEDSNKARITRPFFAQNHRQLIRTFFEHPDGNRICFYDPQRRHWQRFNKNSLYDTTKGEQERFTNELANQLQRATRFTDRCKLYFKPHAGIEVCTQMTMTNSHKEIVGFRMSIPQEHQEFYTWLGTPLFTMPTIHALYDPRVLEDLVTAV